MLKSAKNFFFCAQNKSSAALPPRLDAISDSETQSGCGSRRKMDERLSKLEDQNIEMVDITKEATKESELATKVNYLQ